MDVWHAVRCRVFNKRSRSWKLKKCQIAWCSVIVPVQYPDGITVERLLTFVVVKRGSHVMLLLTNLTIDDAEDPYTVFTSLTRIWAHWPVACSLH